MNTNTAIVRGRLGVGCFACLLTIFLVTGCCGFIPFRKCGRSLTIDVKINALDDSNGRHPVEFRLLVLTERSGFDQMEVSSLFAVPGVQQIIGQPVIDSTLFVQPGMDKYLKFVIPEITAKTLYYFCAAANYSNPVSESATKVVISFVPNHSPICVSLMSNKGKLSRNQ